MSPSEGKIYSTMQEEIEISSRIGTTSTVNGNHYNEGMASIKRKGIKQADLPCELKREVLEIKI